MIERLKTLQATRGNYRNGAELSKELGKNYQLRKEIELLSRKYLNRTVSGCGNCFFDAYIELINLETKTIMEKEECKFRIRRGKLLKDAVNQNVSLIMTQANITNELALYHLKTNPDSVEYFEELPEDWEALVENFDVENFLNPKKEKKATAPKEPKNSKKSGTTKKGGKSKTTKNEEIPVGNENTGIEDIETQS